MAEILGHHKRDNPELRALIAEARRIKTELSCRDWDMSDYRAIAKFIGERDASLCRLTLPLQEWVFVGGHLHTASDVDEMFPEGWREEAEKEMADRAAGQAKQCAISIRPRYPA